MTTLLVAMGCAASRMPALNEAHVGSSARGIAADDHHLWAAEGHLLFRLLQGFKKRATFEKPGNRQVVLPLFPPHRGIMLFNVGDVEMCAFKNSYIER